MLFDALTDPALRELAPQARWIDVGKRGFCRCAPAQDDDQRAAGQARAREADVVVRLKGGDPSIFGRLEEELEALAQPASTCEVVPGVTAALAAAAATQRPLTRRGSGRSVSLHDRDDRSGRAARRRAAPTPRSSTWPASSSPRLSRRLRDAGWPADTPVLRGVARRLARPARTATTRSTRWRRRACCMPAGRPWSPSAPARPRA